jgi:cytochrome c biogenesis protein
MTTTQSGPDSATSFDAAPPEPARPAALGVVGMLRWGWRLLTSMRTALVLLLLIALAAIPGSVLPQRGIDPVAVNDFFQGNPTLAPILEALSLFDVFAAPWFAAIYLLLMTSLTGCVVPRAWHYARALRAEPPPAPRNLSRLPYSARWGSDDAEQLQHVVGVLRRQRFRVVVDGDTVRAEKGYLRETGNLAFHVSLLVLLAALAMGSLFGYRGNAIVVEGEGFANTLTRYDDFTPGRLVDSGELLPFSFTLDDFTARYEETPGDQQGAPRDYEASVTFQRTPSDDPEAYDIRVNSPLAIDGTKVFLLNHGYAPRVTVRDGEGNVVVQGAVPFLPRDRVNLGSVGVIKAPDAQPEQIAFEGLFLPTGVLDPERGPISVFPAAQNPQLWMTAYSGDLGLDSGEPRSVFSIDTEGLTQFKNPADPEQPWRVVLQEGQRAELPNGAGSITLDGYAEWGAFQVAHDPGKGLALASAIVAIVGVMLSLGVRRRRVWARVTPGGPRTVVEVGGLARGEGRGFAEEFAQLTREMGGVERGGSGQHGQREPRPAEQ